jgi:hypothetical protein
MTTEAAMHNEHSKRNKLLKATDQNLRFSQACYEEFYLHLLGYKAIESAVRQMTFRRNMSPLSSGLKSKSRLASCFRVVSTLNMDATPSSERPADFQQATRDICQKTELLEYRVLK